MTGFNYVNLVSFHVGYNSDVEELFDLYKIKKRKRFKVNVAAKKAVETGPAKIGKIIMDDQVEILLANIDNDSYCDIGYDLQEVWTTYLESQPELLNYENLTDFKWRLDTYQVFDENDAKYCLTFGTKTNCLKICPENGKISSDIKFPSHCSKILIDFLAEIKFLIHRKNDTVDEKEMMQFRKVISMHLKFGVTGHMYSDY